LRIADCELRIYTVPVAQIPNPKSEIKVAGLALMYAQGYRPRGPDRHKTVLRFLQATLDPSFKPKLNRLDRIRKKRHQAVYRLAGAVSALEAKGTIDFAEEFVTQLAGLI